MKLISTGAERFLTSDEVADRILEYAGVLARAGTADVVQIAILADSGESAAARLLLGPASQISLAPSDAAERVTILSSVASKCFRSLLASGLPMPSSRAATRLSPVKG